MLFKYIQMGIKNLNGVLKNIKKFPKIHISSLKNYKIGIDFSLFLYRFIYNQNNPIECFLRQILLFFKNNITPVYVLDGNAPDEKNIILEKRQQKRSKIHSEIDRLKQLHQNPNNSPSRNSIIQEEIAKLEKKCVLFSPEMIDKILDFFNLLGVPVIRENAESDWVLAQLNKNNLIDCVLSEDSDLLTFGAKKVLKNFSIREQTCNIYELEDILKEADITHNQFVDMCILCGCDYAPRFKNINCATSYNLIKNHQDCENIQQIPEYSHIQLDAIQNARAIFLKEMDEQKIQSIIVEKKPFQFKEIEKFLNKNIEKKYLIPIFLHSCHQFTKTNA